MNEAHYRHRGLNPIIDLPPWFSQIAIGTCDLSVKSSVIASCFTAQVLLTTGKIGDGSIPKVKYLGGSNTRIPHFHSYTSHEKLFRFSAISSSMLKGEKPLSSRTFRLPPCFSKRSTALTDSLYRGVQLSIVQGIVDQARPNKRPQRDATASSCYNGGHPQLRDVEPTV